MTNFTRRPLIAAVAATALTLPASGCAAGSLGTSEDGQGGAGKVSIHFLVDSGENTTASAKAMVAAFTAVNPDVSITIESRPGGSDGDNIVKTRLATGDMPEVFHYNNGSLLQALKPEQTLTPLDDLPGAAQFDRDFVRSTQGRDGKLYGGPWGTAYGGGIFYNVPLYSKLALQIPKTWDEFMANNEKIKASGVAPLAQTYGESWTAQLPVLADYHNLKTAVPDFGEQYTAGRAKFATTPAALAGFQHIQELRDKGYFMKGFASAKLNDGLKAVATGIAAHYPQIGETASGLKDVAPDHVDDVGFFALPGPDAATNGLTVWPGNGMYIPKTAEGDKLEAAKRFVAFSATQPGCDAYSQGSPPQGPFLTPECQLPAKVSQVAKDTQAYFRAGTTTPALEFESPVKGPALEQICIQVGTGQVDATKGAELYDQDVKKQANQLGLPGWQ
ncbi:ABC transporter substrate-binding protein [Agilicoccus flavus]|uniref:ABC transporter substrate-binding protein n=1 Tax=Agilicoccus flavus TaxID=2775968 RepID=UPI001CF6B44C|nr:ABC transporter substrate-binding protein [Agilicoccus flavus]